MDYDKQYAISEQILVCRAPRSKTYFKESQLYFQKAISEAIEIANHSLNNKFVDGIDCIERIKDVATTHLSRYQREGDMPYRGITKDSCDISYEVANQTILLR